MYENGQFQKVVQSGTHYRANKTPTFTSRGSWFVSNF